MHLNTVTGLEKLPSAEKLKQLHLFSLEKGGQSGDTAVSKYVKSFYKEDRD